MKAANRILLAALAILSARALAAPPAGYKDVTTYSGGSWGSSFTSLVRDDPSAASANAQNLNTMIAANVVLYFPAGTYWIDRTITIGKTGVTLWGDEGAVICRTGVPNTCADAFPLAEFKDPANFWITASGFKMHGLTIKYDVPTSFTGEVTAKSSNTATVRLTDGRSDSFSADTCISRVNYFDENLRPSGSETFFDAGAKLGISSLTTGSDGVKTFKCTLKGSEVGQRLGMACGSNYGQNIVFWGSGASIDDAVFEDVTVANSFGMVMLVRGVRNLTLERFRVDDDDPATIYTASVDGIHATALGGKLTMKDCEFNGLADDILNVHCTGAKVASVDGAKATFESGVDAVFFQRGQTVRFYSSKFVDLGTATISAVATSSGSVTAITVDALPSGVAAGCYIANESWLPEVEITGTKVAVTRARGFLLQTDKPVTISDCEISNTRLAGILCAPGASWGEMGPVNGVTVTNCTFKACGVGEASTSSKRNAAIIVRSEHDKENAGSYAKTANRNVWVEGCFFEDCTASGVSAANITGLVVTNNVFLRCGGAVPDQDGCMVRLRTSDGAKVVCNTAYGGGFTNDVLSVSGNTNVEAHGNGFRAEAEYGGAPEDAVVHVTLRAPGYTAANAPEFARVKFNKAAPLCMISDDMSLGDFCSTWALFNGYPHAGTTSNRQYPRGDLLLDQAVRGIPDGFYDGDADLDGAADGVHDPLVFSDGAGGFRRFACSSAVFAYSDGNYLQITPADVRTMMRTGWSCTFHDVNGADTSDAESIAARLGPISESWEERTGQPLKIMTEPNGNHVYLDACRISDEICWSIFQNSASGYPANSILIDDWTNRDAGIPSSFESKPQGGFARIWAQGSESSFSNAVNAVISSGVGTRFILGGTHGVGANFKSFFAREIQQSDLFWVASVDEIWEYYWLYHHASIENLAYDAATQRLAFDVRLPACPKHRFREVTVNLPGLAGASDWTVSGAVTADAAETNGAFTMNLGAEAHVLEDADALLDLREQYVANPCLDRDARYLVGLLAPGPEKDARLARLAEEWKYSWVVKTITGETLLSGRCNEPTNISYAVPLLFLHGTDLYRIDPDRYPNASGGKGWLPFCGGSFSLDDENPSFATNWVYRIGENYGIGWSGVVLYAEGEDLLPAARVDDRETWGVSMQASALPAAGADVPLGRLGPGRYKFGYKYIRPSGTAHSTWAVVTNGAVAWSASNTKNETSTTILSSEFEIPRAADAAFRVTPNSGTLCELVDCVWVKRTGDIDPSPVLGAVSAATTHTNATLSVRVDSLGVGCSSATLAVALGGATQTRALTSTGAFEFVFDGLEPSTDYPWTVSLVSEGGAASAEGIATTKEKPVVWRETDWFRVRWTADGYPAGSAWDADPAAQARSGGVWTRPAADASSLAGGVLSLVFADAADALVFTPTNASAPGVDLVVEGVADMVRGHLAEPDGTALAGLAFAWGGVRVWVDGAWRGADPATPPASAGIVWRAEFDFTSADAPRVRYLLGGVPLAVDGVEWLPIASSADRVQRVAFLGSGALGDFRGFQRTVATDDVPPPVFASGGGALVFPDPATFRIALVETDPGFWYTAFADDELDGDFVSEAASVRGTGGALALDVAVDGEHPVRFVRVAVSREPCEAGVPLAAFLAR